MLAGEWGIYAKKKMQAILCQRSVQLRDAGPLYTVNGKLSLLLLQIVDNDQRSVYYVDPKCPGNEETGVEGKKIWRKFR